MRAVSEWVYSGAWGVALLGCLFCACFGCTISRLSLDEYPTLTWQCTFASGQSVRDGARGCARSDGDGTGEAEVGGGLHAWVSTKHARVRSVVASTGALTCV